MMIEPGETPEHMDMVYQAVNEGDDVLLTLIVYTLLNEQLTHFIRSRVSEAESPLTREDVEFLIELKEEIFTYRIKATLARELRFIRKSEEGLFIAVADLKDFFEENPDAALDDPRAETIWRALMPRTYDKIGTPTPESLRLHLVLVLTFLQSMMFDGPSVTAEKLAAAKTLMDERT